MPSQPRSLSKSTGTKRAKPGPSILSKTLLNEPPRKRLKPMSPFSKPPVFDLTEIDNDLPTASPSDLKGKGRVAAPREIECSELWVDKYEPTSETDLAVHKRKVQDVRQWLLDAFNDSVGSKLKKYRRILVLTGPAGTGKTATIRVLAKELGVEIVEWRNSVSDGFTDNSHTLDWDSDEPFDNSRPLPESHIDKFLSFLARASYYHNIFTSHTKNANASELASQSPHTRQLILLEDLPNMLHQRTQEAVQEALSLYITRPADETAPIIIVISDAGLRGETNNDFLDSGIPFRSKEVVDVRMVIPADLLGGPFVSQINFNPIAETYLRKALENVLNRANAPSLGQDALELVVATANGDIRSAINALEFACTTNSGAKSSTRRKKGGISRTLLESVTRREQSMALFHLIGRILYNKRKGDPLSSSLSQKKAEKERTLDQHLPDPPPLPPHLKEYHRRTSRVDVDALYADSPIDSSLLGLYIQQNYTQYCHKVEECMGISETLSWVDSSGGEQWYQVNPHQFHLITLGTLQSLPSPVPRKDQKNFKPAFFESLKRERSATDAVYDTQKWLQERENANILTRPWTKTNIILELGPMLRAFDEQGSVPQHSLFSSLTFDMFDNGNKVMVDDDTGHDTIENIEHLEGKTYDETDTTDAHNGGWLNDDDIEDD